MKKNDRVVFIRGTGIYSDSRATKEILALAQGGYYVIVLAWNRDGKAVENCDAIFRKYENIEFHFFDIPTPNGIGIKNITIMLNWILWINKQLKATPDIKAIHACDFDAGISANLFCHHNNIPMIYDIYDYYIDCHHIPMFGETIIEHLQINVINNSAITIICTEQRREQIAKAHPSKVVVIHNSPDVESINNTFNKYDYVYCGDLTKIRLIDQIVSNFKNYSTFSFCFAGFGECAELVAEQAKLNSNFKYMGSLPYSQVLSLQSQSTCLSAVYDPLRRNHKLCAPNKFYEAMALGKPIIVCRGTGIDKIVQENQIGVVINYDVKEFYTALSSLCSNPKLCHEMGNRGRTLYNKKYAWKYMKQKLLDAYSEI